MTIPARHAARYALVLLFSVNLLNYVDRQIIYAIFPLIKAELHLSDTALGFLGSAFMVVYMCSAPLLGWLGDRFSRPRNAAVCWGIQAAATTLCGIATGYGQLLLGRAAIGVGEAGFGTAAPGLLADFFPKERRSRILSLFFLAIPVGSALGYLIGGLLGHHFGWQAAFLIVGIPEFLLILPLWLLREPARGSADGEDPSPAPLPSYTTLLTNRTFVLTTLAMAAMTFAIGGLAQWIPSFLNRVHGLDVARGNTLFGLLTVVAGTIGTLAGGWLGDRLQQRSAGGYFLVSGVGFLIGAPLAALAITTTALPVCLAAMFAAECFLFLNTGPLNTIIINVTHPSQRSMAFAVNIFFIHLLGDAFSPTLIGWLSDLWGLRQALLATSAAIALAAGICFATMAATRGELRNP